MRGGDLRLATVVATSADEMKRFRAAPTRRPNPPAFGCVAIELRCDVTTIERTSARSTALTIAWHP
jgi:hypothetical protein